MAKKSTDGDSGRAVIGERTTLWQDVIVLAVKSQTRRRLDEYRQKVGKQIKMRREELKMTQAELAKETGLPQSHISRLEGGVHAPTHITIERIATALDTTPSQLDPGFED